MRLAMLLFFPTLLIACGAPEGIVDCNPVAGIEPICGFQNPEDLALLPDGRSMLVSQFGEMDGSQPGNIARFEPKTGELRVLFEGGQGPNRSFSPGWGGRDCPGPPPAEFSPHGIHLSRREDGALQLLVVNHGGRESIEFFEVASDGRALVWRGCAMPPEDAYFNSVVATPEGGFLATHMFSRTATFGMLKGMWGADTGYVLEWNQDGVWTIVEGTRSNFPNGIELSPDGRTIYLNVYLAGEVRRIDRDSGELQATAAVASPDNIRWSADGSRLLVASHTGSFMQMMSCQRIEVGACPLAFEIVSLDPQTLERKTLFAHEGRPMGAATVALELGGQLYLGSFKGDRLIHIPAEGMAGAGD